MSVSDGLRAEDVVVRFGGLTALDGVSVHAPPGRITRAISRMKVSQSAGGT